MKERLTTQKYHRQLPVSSGKNDNNEVDIDKTGNLEMDGVFIDLNK